MKNEEKIIKVQVVEKQPSNFEGFFALIGLIILTANFILVGYVILRFIF